ncbi:putative quinol monooxygenase [Nocardiopsis potens]|uniref:putative quinol monooxygenase n=1 Tax=Nocardiopsis potens TaxID=1246458 RepID=UPI00034A6510|nr:putative quinol monooxygenase [Nocardiopsis potens]
MIFIAVKFPVRPERSAEWTDLVAEFTAATRAEPGNVFFEWSKSVEEPDTFVLLEAFADAEAGKAHVESEHFAAAMAWMPRVISATPRIINVDAPVDGWGPMGELSPAE